MAFIHISKRLVTNIRCVGSVSAFARRTPTTPAVSNFAQVCQQTRSLVDFTSADILGIQRFTAAQRQDQDESLVEFVAPTTQERMMVEKLLAILHGKEAALPTSAPLSDALKPLLSDLTERDYLFLDERLPIEAKESLKSSKGRIHSYSSDNMEDIEFMMRNRISRKKILILEHGPNTASIRRLRRLCDVAEKTDTLVVLHDRHGTILYKHLSVDSTDLLSILKKPDLICSTLDLISPQTKVSYLAGTNEVIQKLSSNAAEIFPSHLIKSIIQDLGTLPELAAAGINSLTRSLKLKRSLEEIGFIVKVRGFHLTIVVESVIANKLMAQLWDCGIKVSRFYEGNESGISLTVNTRHSDEHIKELIAGIGEVMKIPKQELESSSSKFYNFTGDASNGDIKMDKKEYSILEGLYGEYWERMMVETNDNHRKAVSLVLDDAFFTGLM